MNFLLDAHLPRQLAVRLRELGHDAIHTLDLTHANRTADHEINDLSVRELRVVATKDSRPPDRGSRTCPLSLLNAGPRWRGAGEVEVRGASPSPVDEAAVASMP